MKICSRLWLAMPRIGRASKVTCRYWKGPMLPTRSRISEKVMVPGKTSQNCGQGNRLGRGVCVSVCAHAREPGEECQSLWMRTCPDVGVSTSVWRYVCLCV